MLKFSISLLISSFLIFPSYGQKPKPLENDLSKWIKGTHIQKKSGDTSLLTLRGLHSGTGQKAQINIFAIGRLGKAYPYHRINAGLYDLKTGKQANDLSIKIGKIPLVRRHNKGTLVGAPQLLYKEDLEQAKHYAKSLFGEETRIYIENEKGEVEIDETIYIPKTLELKEEIEDPEYLKPGDTFTWTPDPNCPTLILDVLIWPDDGKESSTGLQLHKEIENTGTYTVTKQDMKKLPHKWNRRLQLSLIQGKYYFFHGKISGDLFTISAFSEQVKVIK